MAVLSPGSALTATGTRKCIIKDCAVLGDWWWNRPEEDQRFWFFGFRTEKQLRQWFAPRWRIELESLGYEINLYSGRVLHGAEQSILDGSRKFRCVAKRVLAW